MSSALRQRELLHQLTAMGFEKPHVMRAVRRIDVTSDHAAELAIEWMADHPIITSGEEKKRASSVSSSPSLSIQSSSPKSSATTSSSSSKVTVAVVTSSDEEAVTTITMMGFTADEARIALKQNKNNVENAIFWLLERKKEKQEYKLEEIKRREEDEIRVLAKRQLRSPDSPYLHYGDSIALRSVRSSKYLSVAADGHDVNVSSATVTSSCIFIVQNADDEHDRSPVIGKTKVILAYGRGMRIGIEADGSINANRQGPVDPFMTWAIWDAKNEYSQSSLMATGHVYLESAVHNFLQPDDTKVSAKSTTKKFAKWAIVVQPIKIDSANSPMSARTVPLTTNDTSEARWERLQKTYRLAALRIRKVQVEQYRVDIDKQRIAVARKLKEDKSCVVCLDRPPNTVILECGHMCACSMCGKSLEFCPICREKITRLVVIRK